MWAESGGPSRPARSRIRHRAKRKLWRVAGNSLRSANASVTDPTKRQTRQELWGYVESLWKTFSGYVDPGFGEPIQFRAGPKTFPDGGTSDDGTPDGTFDDGSGTSNDVSDTTRYGADGAYVESRASSSGYVESFQLRFWDFQFLSKKINFWKLGEAVRMGSPPPPKTIFYQPKTTNFLSTPNLHFLETFRSTLNDF